MPWARVRVTRRNEQGDGMGWGTGSTFRIRIDQNQKLCVTSLPNREGETLYGVLRSESSPSTIVPGISVVSDGVWPGVLTVLTLLACRKGLWNASMSCSGKPVEGCGSLGRLGTLSEAGWKHASRAQPALRCREVARRPA